MKRIFPVAGVLMLVTSIVAAESGNSAAVLCSAGPLSGGMPGELYYCNDVRSRGQEQDLWCWAASVQMISSSLKNQGEVERVFSQCEQARENNRNKADIDCCDSTQRKTDKFRPNCVFGAWPNMKHLPEFSWIRRALTWNELKTALPEAPVAFSWRYDDGVNGHMMVATGYLELNGERWLLVYDPWPPDAGDVKLITFDHYKTGPYEHWVDYFRWPAK